MRRIFIVVLLLGAVGVTAGCAQLGPQYYKPSQEYSFYPPSKWRYNPPEEEITIFQSHHVRGHDFRPNMNVVAEKTDLVLEEYVEKQRSEWLPKLPGYKLVEEGYVRYGESWRTIYDFYNPHYKIELRALLQLVLHGERIYAITFVAPKNLWRRHKGMFIDSLETFKFGDEAVPITEGEETYDKPELGTR